MDWRELADCQYTDPELFFDRDQQATAKKVCAACPVRAECLAAAMTEEAAVEGDGPYRNRDLRHGVRAGLSAFERWELDFPAEAAKKRAADRASRRVRELVNA